ncbi:MAG: hypothetical protein L0Y71_24525 [Gemmataceae bacterium]|nr:hypothetical protein [Gemmataceae bacterium]
MSEPTAIKDLTWEGSVPGNGSAAADTLEEIKQCLREIRDLQKAHFERYQEFTSKIMADEQARAHQAQQAYIDQLRCQEEIHKAAFQRQLITWAVWGAIIVFGMVGMFLLQLVDFM